MERPLRLVVAHFLSDKGWVIFANPAAHSIAVASRSAPRKRASLEAFEVRLRQGVRDPGQLQATSEGAYANGKRRHAARQAETWPLQPGPLGAMCWWAGWGARIPSHFGQKPRIYWGFR